MVSGGIWKGYKSILMPPPTWQSLKLKIPKQIERRVWRKTNQEYVENGFKLIGMRHIIQTILKVISDNI